MSRRSLAQRLGLSIQQLWGYEVGINRMSVALLHHAADALGVPGALRLPDAEAGAAPRPDCLRDEEAALRFVLRDMRGPDPLTALLAFMAEVLTGPAGQPSRAT